MIYQAKVYCVLVNMAIIMKTPFVLPDVRTSRLVVSCSCWMVAYVTFKGKSKCLVG